MVTIDKNKCVGCGQCERICHHHCIHIIEENNKKTPWIDHPYCSTCSQCVAICPQQALLWDGTPSQSFDNELLPSGSSLKELLKERRTTREFRDRKVNPDTLKEIGAIGGYAPTNNFNLRCIILDDPERIHQLDLIMLRQLTRLQRYIFQSEITFRFFRLLSPHVNKIMRRKIRWGAEQGTVFESLPAAIYFIAGDKNILLSSESAQFAAYNMMLYAQCKRLGTRYMAAGPTQLNSHRKARSLIGLGKKEQILCAFELGVPAVRFHNKVIGKEMTVTFPGR